MPPEAIREFIKRIGVAKANSVVDVGMLEFCIREVLNRTSQRRMAVAPPAMIANTCPGGLPNVGGHSDASSTPIRPGVPAPT